MGFTHMLPTPRVCLRGFQGECGLAGGHHQWGRFFFDKGTIVSSLLSTLRIYLDLGVFGSIW